MLTKMLLLVCFLIWKMMASLLSPTAFALGTVNFADYERAHVGIRWTNVWQRYHRLGLFPPHYYVDGRFRVVSVEGERRRGRRRSGRRKWRTWRYDAALPIPIHRSLASRRFAGRIFGDRGEKKTTRGLLAEASQGDFFSPHGLLGEKTFLLPSCIQVRNLHKVYMTREGKHCAVNSLELTLYENQILALLGMLGCAFLFGFFGFHDVTIWMILTYFVGLLEDSLYVVCCVSMKLEHAVTCDGN
ncbi:hypothetical protein GW17_00032738 [Ensete ventricosum]|nr:hypothetical protein GW17_00032738 [Ensete ventricosum]